MIFFTSDLHLNDSRFKLMGRPFESMKSMNEVLLFNLNNAGIMSSDYLFINGDVCYDKEGLILLEQLPNCKRCLVRGNYDRQFTDQELSKYFDSVIAEGDGVELLISDLRCWVTHYPTRAKEYPFNLVAHIHGAWKVQLNMLNVGVDVHHFKPIDEERVRFYFEAIKKFYDDDVWVGNLEANSKYIGVRGKPGRYLK